MSADREQRASPAGTSASPSHAALTVANVIDHTLLRPDATEADIDRLCAEALTHRFLAVCVHGSWVRRARRNVAGSPVFVCVVAGFPLGAMASDVKTYEARRALDDGAQEIDVVQHIGALKSRDDDYVARDLAGIVEACHRAGARSKVILENALLDDGEKVRACRIAQRVGADFVKTSTGFASTGATTHDVALMRRTVGATMGVKASGGVRTLDDVRAMLAAGATRVGTSASVAIVTS